MNVHDANIISLRDEQASRASILSAFSSLRDNAKYKKDEAAIIIYYAGHGAQTDKPEEWKDWITSGERIEMLCPSDIGCPVTINGQEDVIQGIPDRTISVQLNHISDVKGNNITLVLDCCSSAGMNRGEESETLIRRISNPPPFKNSTDKELWEHGTRGGGSADGFSGKFHASHVLLAACGRDQFAREHPLTKQGFFTYSLMQVLNGNDINTLTYTSLIHKMRMPPWQTPHCEGQGVYRQLFNNRAPGADSSFILAKLEETSKKAWNIILEAGAAQGITVGSRMAVHASNLLETAGTPNPRLGYLTVTSVGPFTCVLEVPPDTKRFPIPPLFYCLIEYRASQKIALYCEDRLWLESLFPPETHNQLTMTIVDDVQSCDLQLTVIGEKVYFDRHNVLVTPHIGTRIPHTIDADDKSAIWNVVKSSLHFYYHLIRTGSDDFRNVWMELKKLKDELSEDFDRVYTPIGKNLIEVEPATIVVDESACLGLTIFNQTNLHLYPYLFYFDPTDLTIIEWYTPPFGAGPGRLTTKVDVPLLPKGMLALGYGNGGVPPWQFLFREGEKKDIGFFKLFLSTRPTHFSSILQQSPFESSMSRTGKLQAVPDGHDEEWWATKLVTIIQVDS